jgi:BON domain-containing protein
MSMIIIATALIQWVRRVTAPCRATTIAPVRSGSWAGSCIRGPRYCSRGPRRKRPQRLQCKKKNRGLPNAANARKFRGIIEPSIAADRPAPYYGDHVQCLLDAFQCNVIRVQTLNHVVYLDGVVSSGLEIDAAESIARDVPGVARVVNSIVVSTAR